MPFKRNLEFYKIITSGLDFPQIIRDIYSRDPIPCPRGKILGQEEYSIALNYFIEDDDFCQGLITKLRTEDLPKIGDFTSNTFSPLTLNPNQGVAEETFFCYYKRLGILCLLSAKNGVKWGTFSNYIRVAGNIEAFELGFILARDAFAKFRAWNHISSVMTEFKVVNGASRRLRGRGVHDLLSHGLAMDSGNIVVIYKKHKRKGGLLANLAKRFSEIASTIPDLEPKSICIKGSIDNVHADSVIDLISQRYYLPITLRGRGRYLDFEECSSLVQNKLIENRELLRDLSN